MLLCSMGIIPRSLADTPPQGTVATVRHIVINRENIFDQQATDQYLTPRLINRLHTTTKASVIQREIWFAQGDRIRLDDIEELERNIRELDLFAQVDVALDWVDDHSAVEPTVDVLVSTTDRLSIVFSTTGSVLGGVGEVSATVGEKNLFGIGHAIELGYRENTEGELLGSFSYNNIRVGNSDAFAGFRIGTTEEGEFATVEVRDEFDHSSDHLSWKVELEHEETRIDYYEQGKSVIEVPRQRDTLWLNRLHRSPQRSGYWRYGPWAEYKQTQYAEATGKLSNQITVPPDSQELFAGASLGYAVTHSHAKVNWLDTHQYEQDLSFGYSLQLALGASHKLNAPGDTLKPTLSLTSRWSERFSDSEFLSTRLEWSYAVESDSSDSWSTALSTRFYSTRLDPLTLATAFRYATAFDGPGLPAEQTLGESNGLRGFPAREFNGEQKALLNLEGRFRTPLQWLTFDLSTVLFLDTGWVGDRGQNGFWNDAHSSAGMGLRIGSRKIFGSSIFRIDLAFPLDQDNSRNHDPLLSMSLGQVFRFN